MGMQTTRAEFVSWADESGMSQRRRWGMACLWTRCVESPSDQESSMIEAGGGVDDKADVHPTWTTFRGVS